MTHYTTGFPLLWIPVADFHEILITNGILVMNCNAVGFVKLHKPRLEYSQSIETRMIDFHSMLRRLERVFSVHKAGGVTFWEGRGSLGSYVVVQGRVLLEFLIEISQRAEVVGQVRGTITGYSIQL